MFQQREFQSMHSAGHDRCSTVSEGNYSQFQLKNVVASFKTYRQL